MTIRKKRHGATNNPFHSEAFDRMDVCCKAAYILARTEMLVEESEAFGEQVDAMLSEGDKRYESKPTTTTAS